MESILSFASSMFQDQSSLYYLGGGAFLIIFLYLLSAKLKGKSGAKGKAAPADPSLEPSVSDEEVVDKKMAKLSAKAVKEARKKAEAAAKLEKKKLAGKKGLGRKAGFEPVLESEADAPPAPLLAPPPAPILSPSPPPIMAKPTQGSVGWPPRPAMHPGATVLAQAVLPVAEAMATPIIGGNFRAVQLRAAQSALEASPEGQQAPPPLPQDFSQARLDPLLAAGAAPRPPVLAPAGDPPPPVMLSPAGPPPPVTLSPAGPPPPVMLSPVGPPPPFMASSSGPPPVILDPAPVLPAPGPPPPVFGPPPVSGPPPVFAPAGAPPPPVINAPSLPLADLEPPPPIALEPAPPQPSMRSAGGVRIGAKGAKSLESDTMSPPEVVPIGDYEPIDMVELSGPAASIPSPVPVPADFLAGPSTDLKSAPSSILELEPSPSFDAVPTLEIDSPPEPAAPQELAPQELAFEPEAAPQESVLEQDLAPQETGSQETGPQETGSQETGPQETGPQASGAQVSDAQVSGAQESPLEQAPQPIEEITEIHELEGDSLDLSLEPPEGMSLEDHDLEARPDRGPSVDLEKAPESLDLSALEAPSAPVLEKAQASPAEAAPEAPPAPIQPPDDELFDSPRAATQVVRPAEAIKARPMSVLESRGGILKAAQTQMTSPIQIDQTQMPKGMKDALSAAAAAAQGVTIQDLDVAYERNTFLTPLEVVYYKLLRSAFTQYLIFPKVTSRAAVSVSSKNPEHLKVAENVLTNTSVSFIICDVKLNIKAVVQLVDDSQPPSNKDKARDYILKKAGCVLVRFYSGDNPPDAATLRKLLD